MTGGGGGGSEVTATSIYFWGIAIWILEDLRFYRTGNSTIRSANPKNLGLEPNMEWIRCTICEIFAFKLYCDLETGVRGHSRSSKTAPFDRAHRTLYSSSIVTMPLSPFPRYSRILVENRYPLVLGARIRGEAIRFTQRPLVTKNPFQNDGPIRWWKNFDDTFSHFDTNRACDGWAHRIAIAYINYTRYSVYAVTRKTESVCNE